MAGVVFGFGTPASVTLGAGLYFLANVLDCADGQIARLKKNGTKVGRVVDGFIDYVVSTAVFLGIAIGLTHMLTDSSLHLYGNISAMNPYVYVWLAALLAGLSSAVQAFYFDFYRNKFLEIVYGKFYSLEDEIREFEEEKERIKREPGNAGFMDNFLITVYLKYTKLQLRSQIKKKSHKEENIPAELYRSKNKLLLRLLSFSGSTAHITLCIACALFNELELFLLTCILPLNILMLIVYFTQIRVHHKLLESAKS
jgi:phosphatidylglycerophosphate synthase